MPGAFCKNRKLFAGRNEPFLATADRPAGAGGRAPVFPEKRLPPCVGWRLAAFSRRAGERLLPRGGAPERRQVPAEVSETASGVGSFLEVRLFGTAISRNPEGRGNSFRRLFFLRPARLVWRRFARVHSQRWHSWNGAAVWRRLPLPTCRENCRTCPAGPTFPLSCCLDKFFCQGKNRYIFRGEPGGGMEAKRPLVCAFRCLLPDIPARFWAHRPQSVIFCRTECSAASAGLRRQ